MGTSVQESMGVGDADIPSRRMRTNEEKRRIVEEALVPGVAVAAVARLSRVIQDGRPHCLGDFLTREGLLPHN